MGRLVNDAGVDFILVGDSVGTTLLGYRTTIPVDMTDMVRHTAAVRRSPTQVLTGGRSSFWRRRAFPSTAFWNRLAG